MDFKYRHEFTRDTVPFLHRLSFPGSNLQFKKPSQVYDIVEMYSGLANMIQRSGFLDYDTDTQGTGQNRTKRGRRLCLTNDKIRFLRAFNVRS